MGSPSAGLLGVVVETLTRVAGGASGCSSAARVGDDDLDCAPTPDGAAGKCVGVAGAAEGFAPCCSDTGGAAITGGVAIALVSCVVAD